MVSAAGAARPFDGVNPNDVVFGADLGEGAFGLVKVGWLRSNPSKKYAIKSMKKHEIIQSKHVDHIENEKAILSKLDHPFAVSSSKIFVNCPNFVNDNINFSLTTMASSKTTATYTLQQSFSVEVTSLPIIALWEISTPTRRRKCNPHDENLISLFLVASMVLKSQACSNIFTAKMSSIET